MFTSRGGTKLSPPSLKARIRSSNRKLFILANALFLHKRDAS